VITVLDCTGLGYDTLMRFCEHCYDTTGSLKSEEFLDYMQLIFTTYTYCPH
jgi:hypothetical protein